MTALLETRDVERTFRVGRGLFQAARTLKAVNGVSLRVDKGEILGLVGESGCGKSTLAKMLLGLLEPTAGEILFDGQPLYRFGYGLSYSSFEYSGLKGTRTSTGAEIHVTVKNTSTRDGDEVVQVYVAGGSSEGSPIRSLRAFQRPHLRAGESRQVDFAIGADALPSAAVEISVGGGQPVGSTPHVKGRL